MKVHNEWNITKSHMRRFFLYIYSLGEKKEGLRFLQNATLLYCRTAFFKKSAALHNRRAVLLEKAQPFLHSEGMRFFYKRSPTN